MISLFKRARSRGMLWLGMPLVSLAAVVVALFVPTLGSAQSQAKPVNTMEPQISGVAVQGQTLTGTTGTWSNNPTSFAFQWRRCPKDGGSGDASNCAVIAGATTNTYTLAAADVGSTIRVRVTATNKDGSASAASNATDVVAPLGAPVPTTRPTITGTAQAGQTLTASPGTWTGTGTITFAYQWLRCNQSGGGCSTIAGATASTYLLTSADVGATVRVRVTATNSLGSTRATSAQTGVVSSAPATGCPSGTGPAQVAAVTAPARLLIDQQQASPPVVSRSRGQLLVRYHVSDTCGQSVQGALVYATAVPFGQLSIPPEQATDATGNVNLSFQTLAGFPLSPRQQRIAMFVRARKPGENLLSGISNRRLFSIPVSR